MEKQGIEKVLEDFDDFFWEQGKYEKRTTGINEYKIWIRSAIETAFKKVRPVNEVFYGDGYASALSDYDAKVAKFLGK